MPHFVTVKIQVSNPLWSQECSYWFIWNYRQIKNCHYLWQKFQEMTLSMTKSDLALPKKMSKAFKINVANDINGDIQQHNIIVKLHLLYTIFYLKIFFVVLLLFTTRNRQKSWVSINFDCLNGTGLHLSEINPSLNTAFFLNSYGHRKSNQSLA